MPTPSFALNELNNRRNELAINLNKMGVEADKSETLNVLVPKVLNIEKSQDEWQPHPDWWDIDTIIDTNVVPWLEEPLINVRYAFVVSDSNNTIVLETGYEYYLSDGTYLANGGTHTWDRTKDKPCSAGYKTRAVVVCRVNNIVSISHTNINSIYVYCGQCYVEKFGFGNATEPYNNKTIQIIKCRNDTTSNYYALYVDSFRNCQSLVSIINIPLETATTGDNAFNGCTSLKSIKLPLNIKSLNNNAFANCTALSSIKLTAVDVIRMSAFMNCKGLLSIELPSSLYSLDTDSFYGCTALINVSIPNNFKLSLKLSYSMLLSVSSIENMIYNYADRTGQTALTLTLGAINLAKLSDDIKAIATNKNITLA